MAMHELMVMACGAVCRAVAALANAAPTVLCGLVVAAVIRELFGPALTRRLLAAGSWWSLVRAWLLGMLLPVCSIGAIPVARELRRAGLAGGAVLAFAVSAPLFNPISLLYGLTLSHPLVIVGFALASMVVVTAVGLARDRLGGAEDSPPPADEPRIPPGWRRAVALVLAMVREAAGPTAGYAAIALLGVGLLAACLPFGNLQRSMKAFDPWAPPLMAAVGTPAFLTPTDAMMQIGSMFDHGNSVGAAFVLLSVGAGLNLGLIAWAWRAWGGRRTAWWLAVFFGAVLLVAAAIERPLSFRDSPPEDHTHAFDVFCMPFPPETTDPLAKSIGLLADRVPAHAWSALGLLAGLAAAGAALALFDPHRRIEARLEQGVAAADHGSRSRSLDVTVPAPVLGAVLLGGLVAISVGAAYLYYPDLPTCLEDLRMVELEAHSAALAGDKRRTQVWIAAWEDLVRRTEVGVWIRRGSITREITDAAEALRERIEALEHAVLDAEAIDREQVAVELKDALAAGRAHRAALQAACAAGCPSGG
ncbi:MAG: permease [Planctomycetota bacterium]